MKRKIKFKKIKVYKYRVTEDYKIKLKGLNVVVKPRALGFSSTKRDVLTIEKGYKSDGPSGITVDTDNFMLGAIVHDVLYEMGRMELLDPSRRKWADKVLYRLCRDQGMSRFRSSYVYCAVRVGGRKSFTPGYEL